MDPLLSLHSVLKDTNVPRDALLIVHSAFSGLSRQNVRPDQVIEVLLDHVRDGGLFMPTMTWRTVTAEHPYWYELQTPSHTGILTEVFRTRYASARSIHPTHSVAGFGRDASMLLSRHHLDDTPVSQNSPYGLMRDYDAFVLMLGVGLECCTAIHLPEEVIAEDLYVQPRGAADIYHCVDRFGRVLDMPARRHKKLERDFPKFAAPLAAAELLHTGRIGDYPWTLVRMRDLLRMVFSALIEDASATLRSTEAASGTSRPTR